MARLDGAPKPPTVFAKIVYWFVRRRLGKVPLPVRIHARHGPLFKGYARMEMAQDKAKRVPVALKSLVGLRAAMVIGCPF